jgi:hypothetical protein
VSSLPVPLMIAMVFPLGAGNPLGAVVSMRGKLGPRCFCRISRAAVYGFNCFGSGFFVETKVEPVIAVL